ncbi:MAG: bifunctional riboflavin kinase/FAD synthetase [Christensenellaceae bacterium]|jgi:riboflavin kinase/FMN adenylyltransferase|nr:bifunctional riboflavin kinase/FAD synthetase [Christensenellaceae bacterium]
MNSNSSQTVLALGYFDGIHLGHRAIIDETIRLAKRLNATPGVVTFADDFLSSTKSDANVIYTLSERMTIFRELGISYFAEHNDLEAILHISPIDFINHLVDRFDAIAFVCGSDHRFGKNRSGNANLIAEYCKTNSLDCTILGEIRSQSCDKISSSSIRKLISKGKIQLANEYLVRPFSITGTVVHGFCRGRTIGFPTANITVNPQKILPLTGVYATTTMIANTLYKSITNIGTAPTFDDSKNVTIETHLLGFSGDLYDKSITVSFVRRIRDIIKFESIDELKKQLEKDGTTHD